MIWLWTFLFPLCSAASDSLAVLNFFVGEVEVRKAEFWRKAVLGQKLARGDWVRTGKESRAEILLPDSSAVRLGENTLFQLKELKGARGTRLLRGRLWNNIRRLKAEYEVASPTAVAAIRGTVFRLDVAPDSTTIVWVYKGQVGVRPPPKPPWVRPGPRREVEGPKEVPPPVREVGVETWRKIVAEILVRERERMTVRRDGSAEKRPFAPEKEVEEWVRWNRKRDEILGLR